MPASEQLGPYRVLRRLGEGGMGRVDEVVHVGTGVRYALKRLTADDPDARARFVREAQTLAALDHPNLVRVHAADLEAPFPYLVQALLGGGSLADRLERGPLPLPEARRLFGQLVAGMAHAHQRGVLHRDLKPENVLFDESGQAVITDFGLTRVDGEAALTTTGEIVGTPVWMAPEQAISSKAADARADVYWLGTLLYALLGGRPPFESQGQTLLRLLTRLQTEPPTPLERLRPDAPPDLLAICARAMHKDPERRWPDAVALLAELEGGARGGLGARWALLGAAALLVAAGLLVGALPGAPAGASRPPPDAGPRPTAPSPRPDATPLLAPPPRAAAPPAGRAAGRWTAFPLLTLRGQRPQACFRGDEVIVWDGRELRRFPRELTRPPEASQVIGAPELTRGQDVSYLFMSGDVAWLGLSGDQPAGSLQEWQGGRLRERHTTQVDHGVSSGRWVALLDAHEGQVHLLDSRGALPDERVACPYPRCAVFSGPDELIVGGQSEPPHQARSALSHGILARLARGPDGWRLVGEVHPYPQGIRGLEAIAERDELLVGDNTGKLSVMRLSALEQLPQAEFAAEFTAITAQAHRGSTRGVLFMRPAGVVLSLAECNLPSGTMVELAVWDPLTRARRERIGPFPGQSASGLIGHPSGEQALFASDSQVYLVTRAPGD